MYYDICISKLAALLAAGHRAEKLLLQIHVHTSNRIHMQTCKYTRTTSTPCTLEHT